ncbi:heme ABC exporter ATP-binding protein CcmA [Devosia sp.]|uniref:heme ABC exporter ATP-binding protein CcmA n=1 Tax=Devosia sp. TaxID=1871048 RepID=UPI001B299886|nr:heme ABC exporter ATP-binding protein CcmA [Devosia sp.]MBO9588696.1 heme ABC exporter ATP-binding protein CcmA [Devosia sp.]
MTEGQVHSPLCLRTFALGVGRGDTVLARDIALSVPAGSGLLLRGPNGAGKSTLLLTLAGLLEPLEGSVVLEGHDEDFGPAFHHCGHRNAIRPRLTAVETLEFWCGINGNAAMPVAEALDRVGLGRQAKLDAAYLSAGQQRRLALARLLVSARPVWLLDEPTSALDTEGQKLLAGLIGDHLAAGGIAVIASHDAIAVGGLGVFTLEAGA